MRYGCWVMLLTYIYCGCKFIGSIEVVYMYFNWCNVRQWELIMSLGRQSKKVHHCGVPVMGYP